MVEEPQMSERQIILGRIQEALRTPAPQPRVHLIGHAPAPVPVVAGPVDPNRFLPAIGRSFDEQVQQFAANAADLKAEFYPVKDAAELHRRLVEMRDQLGWKKAASHKGKLTEPACQALRLPLVLTDTAYAAEDMESSDVGLTECDALIAQTGSVLVTSRSAGGRALTVLPPHHVVLARKEQLIGSLPEAFQLIKTRYGANYPSMISFITGPSRTGDIERILVLGAHGPKKLTIFLL
jgi:L-lactate dehydrogenase complex protein LldG